MTFKQKPLNFIDNKGGFMGFIVASKDLHPTHNRELTFDRIAGYQLAGCPNNHLRGSEVSVSSTRFAPKSPAKSSMNFGFDVLKP